MVPRNHGERQRLYCLCFQWVTGWSLDWCENRPESGGASLALPICVICVISVISGKVLGSLIAFAADRPPPLDYASVAGLKVQVVGADAESQLKSKTEQGPVLELDGDRVILRRGEQLQLLDRPAFHLREFQHPANRRLPFDQGKAGLQWLFSFVLGCHNRRSVFSVSWIPLCHSPR